MSQRRLIVNADDFGLSPGVNRGIIAARERGIVTSASLMVRGAAAADAVEYTKRHPGFSIGLHVDLAEWAFRAGEWICLYEIIDMDDRVAVTEEVAKQLAVFEELMGRTPTHLDSHQHVHFHEPLKSVLHDAAAELDIPLRHFTPGLHYRGDFYGQDGKGMPFPEGISVQSLEAAIVSLASGVSELCCHPGEGDLPGAMYTRERSLEVSVLCDPRVRRTLAEQRVALASFHDWREPAA